MGMESFTDAENPHRSIAQASSEHPDSDLTSYLLQPNGLPPHKEAFYGGYASFGGVDAFEWLSRANDLGGREQAIQAFHDPEVHNALPFPLKVTYNADAVYEDLSPSHSCPHQGLPPRPDKQAALDKGVDVFLVDDALFDDVDFAKPASILASKILVALTRASETIPNFRETLDYSQSVTREQKELLMNIVFTSTEFKALERDEKQLPRRASLEMVVETVARWDGDDYSRDAFDDVEIFMQEDMPSIYQDNNDGTAPGNNAPSPKPR
jgi:hypothetical protein